MGEVDELLPGSSAWDEATRRTVEDRLRDTTGFAFFTPSQARTLEALTSRLLPQDDRLPGDRVPLAARIDALLAAGEVDGYRRREQLWPEDSWPAGLSAIDATAAALFGDVFADLPEAQQEAIVLAADRDTVPAGPWHPLVPSEFIAEVVDLVVTVHYADPRAWAEIGWAGPASPRGYLRPGYGRRDPWEPP